MRRAMTQAGRTVAIIVAAGKGERAGGGLPKQFRQLGGQPVVARAIAPLAAHPRIDSIILVVGEGQMDMARAALDSMTPALSPPPLIVAGGATRRQSVLAGLAQVEASGGARHVLIHDAARPLLTASVIDRLLSGLNGAQGAVPVIPVVDTLARGAGQLGDIVDRNHLYRVQTPQAFVFDAILAAHRGWTGRPEPTDDAQMLRAWGHDVTLVDGDRALEKITMPEDFEAAAVLLGGTGQGGMGLPRTGMGYDVHRLVAGEELWLCGVRIPHDKGLSGHSDADVAIHALVDAILGALADGDIGSHFPPSDPQWRGAPSSRFLTYARDLVAQRDGAIVHVDVTIICEAPKIGPHRDAMRARIAELLQIPMSRISVKATTTERLGFAGRGEGIAAQAVATLTLPDLF
ncbi:bifunctional 2-C-methyl-D-erythritol 4-phosphate cytidylyltransferase/2-C-methyl-D-erythritol 2,4-cyclodiphosphate synthase [Sphingobium sp. H39-3-25]|uniref:bifunctional 2-C-methyl-D-erythritol 4-phosphate cytidylyltransferase/2-C-methyl-D-erythritol 2,4-cyclodiphosphate synthase n=1 Tax=Sphingobium arseniciresistens TaxID=3030834 RepID=UPI0023B898D1|nr:bifunctional 2-C-methyl-D-erythritol 4-phosphate cytidylyltransferase/2-C-methyl-D-erythritol 2,4-cyclodiphosphate synthase [Sphingobium arseniciresistens]